MLLVETGVTLIALACALCWPRGSSRLCAGVARLPGLLAARPGLAVASVGLMALVLRLAILPLFPIPQPFIHDEFSFLLAGDTFASGRLTNATPAMWQQLESFHITVTPTYMSMYFPVQGLILAAGEKLAGNPWYGVCFSAAFLCSAICWMLQGWLPRNWALMGGILAVARIALFSYWVNSYYGGAAAGIGGSLVLGALPRILRRARARDGVLLALGAAILANTRPAEGLLLCLPAACALLWWLLWKPHPPAGLLMRRAAPGIAVFALAAAATGYYNFRVYGSPLTISYQVNRAAYAMAPFFVWQDPRPEPIYRHREMREFYTKWELGDFLYAKTARGFILRTCQKAGTLLFFYFGPLLFVPLILLPRAAKDRRLRYLMLSGAFFVLGLCANAWFFPHYAAPFVAGFYAILLQCLRHLHAWRPRREPSGQAIVRLLCVACIALAGIRLGSGTLGISTPRWPTMWYGTEPLGLPRAHVADILSQQTGKQLAIVRYSVTHSVFDDWVYNAADVGEARVIWAREMDAASNLRLLRYYGDRKAWLVEPDAEPPRISAYK